MKTSKYSSNVYIHDVLKARTKRKYFSLFHLRFERSSISFVAQILKPLNTASAFTYRNNQIMITKWNFPKAIITFRNPKLTLEQNKYSIFSHLVTLFYPNFQERWYSLNYKTLLLSITVRNDIWLYLLTVARDDVQSLSNHRDWSYI